ncbi:MAG: hypothetical protein KDA58_05500 [Planctomycetaceae bacterium]|nr:hypothetical protein [Planctomycetaceae bacterium]
MQRFAANLGLPSAALAMAMLLGVQLLHSPLHHVAEHVAAFRAAQEPVETHSCSHGHAHQHEHAGHGHQHADVAVPCGHSHNDAPGHDHDAECQLCDLALAPAMVAQALVIPAEQPLICQAASPRASVFVSALMAVAQPRGPPVAA